MSSYKKFFSIIAVLFLGCVIFLNFVLAEEGDKDEGEYYDYERQEEAEHKDVGVPIKDIAPIVLPKVLRTEKIPTTTKATASEKVNPIFIVKDNNLNGIVDTLEEVFGVK